MGFLKKIGKGLKKTVGSLGKMASIKNVIKVATGDGKSVLKEAAQRTKDSVVNNVVGEFTKKASGEVTENNMEVKTPSIGEIGLSALGGALTSAGMTLSNNQDVATQMANAGDNVAMAWLKKNWLKLAGGLVVGTLILWGFVKLLGRKGNSRRAY